MKPIHVYLFERGILRSNKQSEYLYHMHNFVKHIRFMFVKYKTKSRLLGLAYMEFDASFFSLQNELSIRVRSILFYRSIIYLLTYYMCLYIYVYNIRIPTYSSK